LNSCLARLSLFTIFFKNVRISIVFSFDGLHVFDAITQTPFEQKRELWLTYSYFEQLLRVAMSKMAELADQTPAGNLDTRLFNSKHKIQFLDTFDNNAFYTPYIR